MTRSAIVSFLVVAAFGLAGLALAGAADQRGTAFSLEIQSAERVLTLKQDERACQGPVMAPAAFGGLELWIDRVRAPGTTLRITVASAAGAPLVTGSLHALSRSPTSPNVRLSGTVASGSLVSVCFQNAGRAPVSLLGAPAEPGSGALHQDGRALGSAAAIVMLRERSSSLLSLLPTIVTRAALFRPTWMGAWTFWLLLGGLVAAFPISALALRLAISPSERREPTARGPAP